MSHILAQITLTSSGRRANCLNVDHRQVRVPHRQHGQVNPGSLITIILHAGGYGNSRGKQYAINGHAKPAEVRLLGQAGAPKVGTAAMAKSSLLWRTAPSWQRLSDARASYQPAHRGLAADIARRFSGVALANTFF